MVPCVGQTQGAHRLRLGPIGSAPMGLWAVLVPQTNAPIIRVSGASAPRPAAGTGPLYNQMVWVYPAYEEKEMKRMFAVRRKPVICLLAMMGGAMLAVPTVCPAQSLCCPPFPLPRDLEVGDRWTYLRRDSNSFTDTIETVTSTITITVDARHELSGQTYFELSDGGLYRVDDERKTWQYDADTESEILYWDLGNLWADPVLIPEDIPEDSIENWLSENQYYGLYLLNSVEEVVLTRPIVANGEERYTIPSGHLVAGINRVGPIGLDDLAQMLRGWG